METGQGIAGIGPTHSDMPVARGTLPNPKPFLLWPGGKRRHLPMLRRYCPESFDRYHEVFVGGGALFLDLRARGYDGHSYIYDALEPLIRTYSAVQTSAPAVARAYRNRITSHSPQSFRRARCENWRALLDPEIAAWMLYLTKTCYNGLWRLDNRGRFTVGLGRDRSGSKRHRLDERNLTAVSRALGNTKLVHGDFSAALNYTRTGDFAYLDPPYATGFTKYTALRFPRGDQCRLRDVCDELSRRGVMVMQTNSDCRLIHELYARYRVTPIVMRHLVGNPYGGGESREVIIRNY